LPGGSNSAGINTVDVVATQRHFLRIAQLSGCRLTAADVNGDNVVNTVDTLAIQRFYVGFQTGLANVGRYQFTPVNRTYSGMVNNQTNQNYNALVVGDVAPGFVYGPENVLGSGGDDFSTATPIMTTVALPNVTANPSLSSMVTSVTTSTIAP